MTQVGLAPPKDPTITWLQRVAAQPEQRAALAYFSTGPTTDLSALPTSARQAGVAPGLTRGSPFLRFFRFYSFCLSVVNQPRSNRFRFPSRNPGSAERTINSSSSAFFSLLDWCTARPFSFPLAAFGNDGPNNQGSIPPKAGHFEPTDLGSRNSTTVSAQIALLRVARVVLTESHLLR